MKERRQAQRRPILATFSFSIVVPKKGIHRLEIHDLSEKGVGFQLDIEGESSSDFSVEIKDVIHARFYLNPSLYIPITLQIARIEPSPSGRKIGAEFYDKNEEGYSALLSFLKFLDQILQVIQIDPQRI
jgi:PilZ domain